MDSAVIALGSLLGHLADELDVPAEVDAQLTAAYRQLATWIRDDHDARFRASSEIYPQGSRRLGVMVQPIKVADDHDVDLVYRRNILRESITQAELKRALGEQLRDFVTYLERTGAEVPILSEGSRCWTLRYPSRRFHMDILPALPNDEPNRPRDTSILITDKDLRQWQPSDPQGYAAWFSSRMVRARDAMRALMAKADGVHIQDIPSDTVKTPLQRMVQILKRHRDQRFEGDRKHKPASILITTLAARSYVDGVDLSDALRGFRRDARSFIVVRNGVEWIVNPTNDRENFADRWITHPDRRTKFFEWLDGLEHDMDGLVRQDGLGLHRVAEALRKSFGADVTDRAMKRAGNEVLALRQQGALRSSAGTGALSRSRGTPVRPHTFFGGRG